MLRVLLRAPLPSWKQATGTWARFSAVGASDLSDAPISGIRWIRAKRWARYVSRANVVPASSAGVRGGIAGEAEDEELCPKGSIAPGVA